MSTLVNIDSVFLYTDGAPGEVGASATCAAMRAFLVTHAIPFQELWYADPAQWPSVHAAISSWTFAGGPVAVTQFPYVHWTEHYDDGTTQLNICTNLTALPTSNLVPQVASA